MLPRLAQLLIIIIIIIHRPISTSTRSGSYPRKKGRPCRHLDQAALLLLIVAANRRAEGVRFRESVRDWSRNREQGSTSWGAASLCLSAGTITVTHEREEDPETERKQSPFCFSLSLKILALVLLDLFGFWVLLRKSSWALSFFVEEDIYLYIIFFFFVSLFGGFLCSESPWNEIRFWCYLLCLMKHNQIREMDSVFFFLLLRLSYSYLSGFILELMCWVIW